MYNYVIYENKFCVLRLICVFLSFVKVPEALVLLV